MDTSKPSKLVELRSRAVRGSYSREALRAIFKANPVAHVAYLHNGDGMEGPDGDERPRILNLPLLTVLKEYERPEGQEEVDGAPSEGELVAYIHTYYGSRLTQAIKKQLDSVTISTTKIDGLILDPMPLNHSFNYRSATIYGHSPVLLPNTPSGVKEKIRALEMTINDGVGYNRTAHIGLTDEDEAKRTAVIRVRIEDASCKQRIGGPGGDKPPIETESEDQHPGGPDAHEFAGVVPCWTHYETPRGVGRHKEEITAIVEGWNKEGQAYAVDVAYARTKVDGR